MEEKILFDEQKNLFKLFLQFVSRNILAMAAVSAYIIADTYFIAQVAGEDGITALNIVLPFFFLVFALGQLIAVGSATRFTLAYARKSEDAKYFFGNAFFYSLSIGLFFSILFHFYSVELTAVMGGDEKIAVLGGDYIRTSLYFSPCFMLNLLFLNFARNAGEPTIAMIATISSSLFNIVLDYLLVFTFNLGLFGAALATGVSPIVSIVITLFYFLSKHSIVRFFWEPSMKRFLYSVSLGGSAFISEVSAGVITAVYNYLFLYFAGNIGVAAFGIVANLAIVVISIFNGLTLGAQPLIAYFHGTGNVFARREIFSYGKKGALFIALVIVITANALNDEVISLFNPDNNQAIISQAKEGIFLYFSAFFCTGLNHIYLSYLTATEEAKWAGIISFLRGFIVVIVFAVILSYFGGIRGLWMAYFASETVIFLLLYILLRRRDKKA